MEAKEDEEEVEVVVEEENHHPKQALAVSILVSCIPPPFPSQPTRYRPPLSFSQGLCPHANTPGT